MIADAWLERLGRRAPVRERRRRLRAGAGGRSRRRVRRPSPRLLIALAVTLVALFGAWMWVRSSSLVAVQRVTVTGESGPDAGRIRTALVLAARSMTTLDVNTAALHTAVAPYPVVKALRVSTQFPHGMRIEVVEEVPVAEISFGGRMVAVASDGMLVHDAGGAGRLPTIQTSSLPGGPRITDRQTLEVVAMLTAAPYQLLSHLSQASLTGAHGLVAQLRDGPAIYFGAPGQLAAKWSAAAAVLVDGGSAGAQYIDVSDPQRPVAGASGGSTAAGAGQNAGATGTTEASTASTATTTAATSPGAAAGTPASPTADTASTGATGASP